MPTSSVSGALALSAAADAEAGYSYPTYLRLRLRAVLDGFAKLIITRQEYSPSSAQALFVQRVLSEWAESQEVFAKTPTATDLQRKLIDTLDLARLERQIRFLIAAISWWYKPSAEDRPRVPDRQQLDQAKHDLYRLIDQLNGLARLLRDDENIRDRVDRIFGRAVLVPKVPNDLDGYVVEHSDDLAQLQALVQVTIGTRLASMFAALDADLVRITESWTPWARNELLTRHLGFAFWDIILYPIQAVGGVNERDHVEVMRFSPFESELVATSEEKQLKGVDAGALRRLLQPPRPRERLPVGTARHRRAADRAAVHAARPLGGLVPQAGERRFQPTRGGVSAASTTSRPPPASSSTRSGRT